MEIDTIALILNWVSFGIAMTLFYFDLLIIGWIFVGFEVCFFIVQIISMCKQRRTLNQTRGKK